MQNLKFLAFLVEILTCGIVFTTTMNLMHIKRPMNSRVKKLLLNILEKLIENSKIHLENILN